MIRVTVELLPYGDESRKQVLGRMAIVNDATGTPTRGNYHYAATGKSPQIWKRGGVKGFPRQRLLAWDLLYRVLRDAVGDRNE